MWAHISASAVRRGFSGRTLSLEIGVLARIMKRGKAWSVIAEDVKRDKENTRPIGRVLTVIEKKRLFETAHRNHEWLVAYCAAMLAVNTTCRRIELKHLRWRDVDLFDRSIIIRRSETAKGHRLIPPRQQCNGRAFAPAAKSNRSWMLAT
jgi:integrase